MVVVPFAGIVVDRLGRRITIVMVSAPPLRGRVAQRRMQGACVIVLIAHVLLLVSYVDPVVSCVMYGFACQWPRAPSRPSLA
jgi:hypothetical protein